MKLLAVFFPISRVEIAVLAGGVFFMLFPKMHRGYYWRGRLARIHHLCDDLRLSEVVLPNSRAPIREAVVGFYLTFGQMESLPARRSRPICRLVGHGITTRFRVVIPFVSDSNKNRKT
jgi:hypothetical protein